jgi:hypothetical protein
VTGRILRGAVSLLACGVSLSACGEAATGDTTAEPSASSAPHPERAERVARTEQEAGLDQCGALLENLRPESVPTFATLMRECSGLYAARACRDALREGEFSRPRVHEVCSQAYCEELRAPRPSFCTRELPSDAEFLTQFGEFSEAVLRRDLRRVMDREGAREIARLMAQLIRDQASR